MTSRVRKTEISIEYIFNVIPRSGSRIKARSAEYYNTRYKQGAKRRAQTNKGREVTFMSEFLSQGDRERRARRYSSSKKVQKKQQLAPS